MNCLIMIQPTLFAYSFNGPPEVTSNLSGDGWFIVHDFLTGRGISSWEV